MTNGTRHDTMLALDRLTVDLAVARRLAFSLARRYRALPVAEDAGRVTVAMADPDDAEAREAVAAALGEPTCVVWSDPLLIEVLLGRVWPAEAWPGVQVAACLPEGPGAAGADLEGYARRLAGRLQAGVQPDCDLAVFGPGGWPAAQVLLGTPAGPRAVLVVQHPRWPAARVLCVLGGDAGDEAAVAWAVRAAHPGPASVTLLAAGGEGLPTWLAADTPAGRCLRRAAGLLAAAGIEGRLRLRQGPVDRTALREARDTSYDLLVLPATVAGRAADEGGASVAQVLLAQMTCPLLVTAGSARPPVAGAA